MWRSGAGEVVLWVSQELLLVRHVLPRSPAAVLAVLPWESVLLARLGGLRLDPSYWGG